MHATTPPSPIPAAMDGNKDEAARCLNLAASALAAGDTPRALKLLRIAHRLDPTLPIPAASSSSQPQPQPIPKPILSSDPDPICTAGDNAALVHDIKNHSYDYYKILGVEITSSAEDIRRAYRKLSLKVHPDKNNIPGADDAFKALSNAFKCLTDDTSRRRYDRTRITEDYQFRQQQQQQHSSNHNIRRRPRRPARNGFFDGDFDPDEIYRSFFGSQGDIYRAHRFNRARAGAAAAAAEARQQEHTAQKGGGFSFVTWLQVFVVLIFLLVACIPVSEPLYSLHKTRNYVIRRATSGHGVEYFVKSDEFDRMYPQGSTARDNLEKGVFRGYKSKLSRYCHMEMKRRHWATHHPTPHCDKLRGIGVA